VESSAFISLLNYEEKVEAEPLGDDDWWKLPAAQILNRFETLRN
jgi:hypothetical protein